MRRFKAAARSLLAPGSEGVQRSGLSDFTDLSVGDREIIEEVRPYTLTSLPRLVALLEAVDYVVKRGIPGAFAECGVWRGGSVMAIILKLQSLGVLDRDICLYDTFEGMTEPTEKDTSPFEAPAAATWSQAAGQGKRGWDQLFDPRLFNEESVRRLLCGTGYPVERLNIVKGQVEQTLPARAPQILALLRLDTDWYESTRHELTHLYPRIGSGGVLIIDDYGHWDGCRRAVDEYFSADGAIAPLLIRIDYTARIAVKP